MSEFNNHSYLYVRERGNGNLLVKPVQYSEYNDAYLLELPEEDLNRFIRECFKRRYDLKYEVIFGPFLSIGNRIFRYDFYDHDITEITDLSIYGVNYSPSSFFEKYVNFITNKQAFKTSYHEIKESIWVLHNLFYIRAVSYVDTHWKYHQFGATVKVVACDKDGLHEVKCNIIPYKSWHEHFKKDKSKYF